MKKTIALLLALCLCICISACGTEAQTPKDKNSNFKMTTSYAAEQSVESAIKEWMSTKFLSFDCTEFKYNITKTERSSRSFSGDSETGMMWYNAYGTATFFNDYGDVLATGDFQVFFGHNGVDSTAYIAEDTVVNLH